MKLRAALPAVVVLALAAPVRAQTAPPAGAPAAAPETETSASGDTAGFVSPARAITLDEAVALAQRNAPQVIQAIGQRQTALADVRSAWASFIPSLSLSAGSSRQFAKGRTRTEGGQVITLPSVPWSYNFGLSSSVDLFAGGQRIFDIQQARARSTAAGVNETLQRYAATLSVKQQYFDVLAARESESAARSQLEQAQQQLRVSSAKVRNRTATRSDSLRAEIQVRTARIAILQARTALEVANASLTRAVGVPDRVTAAVDDTTPEQSLALSDAELRRLADEGPAVAQARADLDAARAASRTSWSAYLPSLSAGYSRGGNAVGDTPLPANDAFGYSGSLRFSLSFPVFNQLQRESQRTAAEVALTNAEASLRDARLAASQGLAQSLGAYREARERVASQVATLSAAEEDLRVQQQRYNVGGSTLLDVLTSETQLDQARQDLIRARYDQRVARAQLEALIGRSL